MEKRNPNYDLRKSEIRLKQDCNKVCIVEGCEYPLTTRVGPGDKSLCREHQILMREYGGPGRLDRLHTFHRDPNYVCADCGVSMLEDERLSDIKDEMVKLQIVRYVTHGDHVVSLRDGGDNSAKNIRTLCPMCHGKKTILNGDHLNISKNGKET